MAQKIITVPLLLTSFRIVSAILLIPFLIYFFIPYNNLFLNCCVALIFFLCAVTDFFDGFLARRLGQETDLGRFLDPFADKVFVMAALLALVAIGKLWFFWAVILIAREFFITGLREVAQYRGFTLSVAYAGKVKTAIQTVLLGWIIINPYHGVELSLCNAIEFILLWASVLLAWGSAALYFYCFCRQVRKLSDGYR